MRDRLIQLISNADEECKHSKDCKSCSGYGKGSQCMNYHIADHLLANGVIVPPCKVGDVVYEIIDIGTANARILDLQVLNIKIDGIMTTFFCKTVKKYLYNYGSFSLDNFGKTVFLTREEAEAKLKEGAE